MTHNHVSGPGKAEFRSPDWLANQFQRMILLVVAAVAVSTIGVLIFVPPFYSVPVVNIPGLPFGRWQGATPVFSYYPNALLEILEGNLGQDGQPAKFLRCRLSKADGWTGFGILTTAEAARDATLQLHWRCSGTAPHIPD